MGVNFKDKDGNIIAKPLTVLASDEQVEKAITNKIADGTIDNITLPDGTAINTSASSISVKDTGNYFESDKMEDVLQEIGKFLKDIKDNGIVGEEPNESDVPIVFLKGEFPNQVNDVKEVDVEYISKTKRFKCYGNISRIDDGTKYDFDLSIFSDSNKSEKLNIKFKHWGEHNTFKLGNNFLDTLQVRNTALSKIWSDVVKSRSDYGTLPEKFKNAPCSGVADGFFVKVFLNNEYYNLYTINIPLKDWAFNMDKSSEQECILLAKDYNSGCFLKTANFDGTDWTDELHDSMPQNLKTSFNNAINHVLNSDDASFKNNLGNYFDVNSLIDYYIFQYVICGTDNMGKNQMFITYDGVKWMICPYNMNMTLGLAKAIDPDHPDFPGSRLVSVHTKMQSEYESGMQSPNKEGNKLFNRLEKLFINEIYARVIELTNDALSYANVISTIERLLDPVHEEQCDGIVVKPTEGTEESIKLKYVESTIEDVRAFLKTRIPFVINAIKEIRDRIPCESITLNKDSIDLSDGQVIVKNDEKEIITSYTKGFIVRGSGQGDNGDALGDILITRADMTSDFIPIVLEDTLEITQVRTDCACGVVAYNENKEYNCTLTNTFEWISSPVSSVVDIPDAKFKIEKMPEGAAYIRLCFNTTDLSDITIMRRNNSTYVINPTEQLVATVSPTNTTDAIEWSVRDKAICSVKDGLATGLSAGSTVITVKCGDKTDTCNVNVETVQTGVLYTVTTNLTNCAIGNQNTTAVKGSEYSTTITPDSGYTLSSVVVTMNGIDITRTSYKDNSIYIGSVTGDIVINITATRAEAPNPDADFRIESVTGGTFTTAQAAKLVYVTNKSVAKHEFSNNAYGGVYYYTDAQVAHNNGDGVTVSTVEGEGTKYTMTFDPGVLSVGTKNGSLRLTDDDGNVILASYTLTITEQNTTTLSITSINGGTFAVTADATVKYTTNIPVVKHEFNLHTENGENFTEGTNRVTNSGNNYTMTFPAGDLTEGTKYGAIRVTDANGNVVTKTFTLVMTSSPGNIATLAITSITGGTYTTSQQAKITYVTNMAVSKHEFNLHYNTSPDTFTDGTSKVTTASGNKHTMTFNVGDLTAGTKSACIRVTGVDGSVAKATVTLTITGTTDNDHVVCSCKGVTYNTIANAVRNGATTVALVKSRTGAGTGCGRCVGAIQDIINEITQEGSSTPALAITSISGGTYKTTQQAKIVYTTNRAVVKHEFINHYTSGTTTGFSDGNSRVTSSGTTYTMTFNPGELSAGTKNGAIRVTDANGKTVVKTYTLIINSDSTAPTPPQTPTTPSDPSSTALKDWDAFNNTHGNYVAYSPTQVAVSGKRIRMKAIKKTTTVVPKGGTGQVATKNYLSGAMVSKKAFKYGTFTFKFKLSSNDIYLWPMIWTLPDNTTVKGPEMDLLESWGSFTNNSVVQTLHVYQNGAFKSNVKQAQTHVDLTKEHTLKIVWSTNNTITMYCDGKQTVTYGPSHMTNPNTGEIDYQVWFLNLGLGTYSGIAPNGTGWFEITDYSFEPVYTRTRQKQHYWQGNFTDGTLPSGTF